jgi:homoserine dehydrogenase
MRHAQVIVLGTGLVGLELIRQIKGEQGIRIRQVFGVDVRVIGLADSSGFVMLDEEKEEQLEQAIGIKEQKKSLNLHGKFAGKIENILDCMLFNLNDILIMYSRECWFDFSGYNSK